MAVLAITVVDSPRFGQKPSFQCAPPALEDRPSLFGWNYVRVAACGQNEVLKGRHFVDDPSGGRAHVYSIGGLHEIPVGRRLSRILVARGAQDDAEMREV